MDRFIFQVTSIVILKIQLQYHLLLIFKKILVQMLFQKNNQWTEVYTFIL